MRPTGPTSPTGPTTAAGRIAEARARYGFPPRPASKEDIYAPAFLTAQLKKEKDAFEAILDEDFKKNRDAYETGVPTAKGMLFRKPSYRCAATPILEAA